MSTYLEELAVRFVERDGLSTDEHEKIAANAADFVLHPEKHGSPTEPTVLILVKSIHRWVFSGDDDDPSEFAEKNREKHARGLKFLAMTLNALPKDFLQSTQIKMLASFFCSIYQQQDPAGLATATEAVLVLMSMANFPPSSADDIITSVGKMAPENFSKQLAKDRLHILRVVKTLLLNPKSARVLQKRYEGSEFLLPILLLAKRERDPVNLLNWFRLLETLLKHNKISPEVATAAFESFSPFFPISIRRSTASGPDVTEDELKEALRSCFAANGLLAQHTFPFLLEKLDDGGSLTASAKLDILRTTRACVMSYEPVDTCLVPYVTKIWSSLKYEVRNGEVPEAVKETLSIFECLPQRLASQPGTPDSALVDFLLQAWKDCVEDLENPTYTEQAGSILISVAGGGVVPFCHICPRLLEAARRNIAQPKSEVHTKYLLILLNNLLRTRLRLVSKLEAARDLDSSTEKQVFPGPDFDIPVSIVHDLYFKLFRENTVERPTKEQADIAKEALKGLSLVVQQQKFTEDWKVVAAYDQDTLKEICTALAYRATNCFNVPPTTTQELQDIDKATVEALKTTVKFFPEGYGKILAGVLSEVRRRDWEKSPAERTFNDLHALCQRVAFIGCTDVPVCPTPIINFAAFTGTMLHMLSYLLDERINLKACAIVADALATGMAYFSRTCEGKSLKTSGSTVAPWDTSNVEHEVHKGLSGFPHLVHGAVDKFDPVELVQSAKPTEHDVFTSFLLLGVYTLSELYRHATTTGSGGESDLNWHLRIRGRSNAEPDDQESGRFIQAYLEEVGLAATTVIRELSPSAQKDMDLAAQMIWYFQGLGADSLLEKQDIGLLGKKEGFALTCGIARGIRPEIVSRMSDVKLRALLVGGFNSPKGFGQSGSTARPRIQAVQDHVAFLLANKYNTRAQAAPEDGETALNHDAWIGVLSHIEKVFNNETGADLDDYSRFTAILAGAFARRDKYITSGLTTALSHAAAKGSKEMSPQIARILSQLFATSKALDPANHTIQKPLYLQWTYHQCVHPILQLAYPLSQQTTPGPSTDSTIYAIYVLHAVKRLSFQHYAPDAASIVRVVLAAMQKAADNYDVEAASTVTLQILHREPTLFRGHVSSVVAAAKRVYEKTVLDPSLSRVGSAVEGDWPAGPVAVLDGGDKRFRYEGDREKIRKMSFRILQMLPVQFEETIVRPHADEVRVHLSWALGDRVREVRRVAEVAQGAWAKVST
ncbi:hypothetical protein VM1G_01336 [Cytospora mali]|uniref:MMS19 nucleotide excision repair protein n=1 Tax=Cytospora mali TaxID=578113 RepID=A0A194VR91_CYTMA|nr:hypothetical protein VM1G_01336 [Valsa mali]